MICSKEMGCAEATQLRMWKRQRMRAIELGAALPNLMLQVQAIDRVGSGVLGKNPQSLFRVSSFRMEGNLDECPTEETLLQFYELMLAEMDALSTGAMTVSGEKPSVKAMQNPGKANGKGDNPSMICRDWGTDGGCKFGKACKYEHPTLKDQQDRCWICSSKQHRKSDCPARSLTPQGSGGSGGAGINDGKGGQGDHGKGPMTGKNGQKGTVKGILNMWIFQPVMLVYWRGISPISRVVFHPSETHLFSAIYRGPITRFMMIVGGPPCRESS